jgi:hypothetical protein
MASLLTLAQQVRFLQYKRQMGHRYYQDKAKEKTGTPHREFLCGR